MQTTVEVGAEFLVRRGSGRGEGADDQLAAGRQPVQALSAQVAEPALDPMAGHGVPDRAADHEAHPGRESARTARVVDEMHHQGVAATAPAVARDTAQVGAAAEAMRLREHGREGTGAESRAVEPEGSDSEALAALATTGGQDGASGAGAHAQPEAVHLVAAAVVRLVRTLAHELSPMVRDGQAGSFGWIARCVGRN